MISRVCVTNFRSLADVDVQLDSLTVLVGRNGAGKSAFIDVMRFVRDALTLGLEKAIDERGGFLALRRWIPDSQGLEEIKIIIHTGYPANAGKYSFRFGETSTGIYAIREESCRFGDESFERVDNQWRRHGFSTEDDASKNYTQDMHGLFDSKALVLPVARVLGRGTLEGIYQSLTQSKFYTFSPEYLRQPQKANGSKSLKEHGENLAACLQDLRQSDAFNDLQDVFRRITGINNLRVDTMGSYLIIKTEHVLEAGVSVWFDLSQESDGTIHLLALLTALYQNTFNQTIVLDESELFLHPVALNVIAGVIQETARNNQVIIATQSPDFISAFHAFDIRAVEQKDGVTNIGSLLAEQMDTINSDIFTTGDLLRIEGLRTTPFEAVSADNG